MPSVSAGKPSELAYLDRSVSAAEANIDADVAAVAASVLTRLGRVKSLQVLLTGFATGDATKNVTIAAVNIAKTILFPLGRSKSDANADLGTRMVLLDSTTVQVVRGATGIVESVGIQVVEFE